MRTVALIVLLGCAAIFGQSEDVFGVPASKQSLYTGENFACMDKSKTISRSAINDDYCDCSDGSDEPGTSACSNGQFYCTNVGFRGQYLPSSRVGDGVCDCCDGSDEMHAKHSKCSNTCESAGAEWRAAEAERIRVAEAGARAKLAYMDQAKAALSDAEGTKAELSAKQTSAEQQLAVAEEQLAAAERQAEADALQQHSSDSHKVLRGLSLDGASAEDLGTLLVQLARTVNGGAKALAKLAEGAALKRGVEQKDLIKINWPTDVPDDLVSAPKAEAVKSAEAAILAAKSDLREAKDALADLESKQAKDYGPSNAFFPLDGKCVELRQAQYTYKVCPFGSAKQDHTLLGNFEGFQDSYTTMRFTNGQTCWNGPARSLTVKLVCGVEEVLSSVDEPSKCEYTATLATPAVCDDRFARPIDTELVKEEL